MGTLYLPVNIFYEVVLSLGVNPSILMISVTEPAKWKHPNNLSTSIRDFMKICKTKLKKKKKKKKKGIERVTQPTPAALE